MTNPAPCPFCGCALNPVYSGSKTYITGWGHPGRPAKDSCYYAGVFIGIRRIPEWNRRPAATAGVVHMVIEADGHPRFQSYPSETSHEVDFDLINRTLQYYREQAK